MSSASLSHVTLKVSYEQIRVGISGKSDLSMNPGKFTAPMFKVNFRIFSKDSHRQIQLSRAHLITFLSAFCSLIFSHHYLFEPQEGLEFH